MDIQFTDALHPLTSPPRNPPFQEWQVEGDRLFASFHHYGRDFLLRFPGLADFVLSADGFRVTAFRHPSLTQGTLDHLLLNQVRPLALSLQGRNMFHASAVKVGCGAAVFLGRSGQGKSTLAASFAKHGHGFLTDDGLELKEAKQGYLALPSHASIRLWDDSLRELAPPGAGRAEPVQYTTKARLISGPDMPHVPNALPLLAIFVLTDAEVDSVRITPMEAAEALIALVNHSFLLKIDDQAVIAHHFDRLVQLVHSVSIFRLDHPRRYERLAEVREAVTAHVNSLEQSRSS